MYRFLGGRTFSYLLGKSSTFFIITVCVFLGLIITPFIHLLTFHVLVTNPALSLVPETLNIVVGSFYPLFDASPGAFPLSAHLMVV